MSCLRFKLLIALMRAVCSILPNIVRVHKTDENVLFYFGITVNEDKNTLNIIIRRKVTWAGHMLQYEDNNRGKER